MTMTLADFIRKYQVSLTAETADEVNPFLPDAARHWSCTLECGGRKICVPFSTGSAIPDPTAVDVLGFEQLVDNLL